MSQPSASEFFDDDIVDDPDLSHDGRGKVELTSDGKNLLEIAAVVKEIVHKAKVTKGSKWVCVRAAWWRRYAEATKFDDAEDQEVRTLPSTFHECMPGYFLADDSDERKEALNNIETPPEIYYPREGFLINENDDIHNYVRIPLEAFEKLKGRASEKDIFGVVMVHGDRGVKETEGERRLIIDCTKIRLYFHDESVTPQKDYRETFPSDVSVNDAFNWFFKQKVVTDENEKEKYVFKHRVKYGVPQDGTKRKSLVLEYRYDRQNPHRMVWDTTMGMKLDHDGTAFDSFIYVQPPEQQQQQQQQQQPKPDN